ncbi:MAG: heparinase, partial [Acidobacteria bacterium]
MGDFLASLTHPNGKIALFNDATQEIAPGTASLLAYLHDLTGHRAEKRSAFPHSGYFVHEDAEVFLAIDGGELGPNYLPGHAHADIFSFELSLGANPFVVDSGVFEYQAGEMRSYVRGTRAHNTLCVDRRDQAECWGGFRVARRFAPFAVSFRANNGKVLFEGSFDGYAHLLGDGIIHHRRIEIDPERRELRVHDSVEGTGRHLVESLLHLHPAVQVTQEGSRTVL